MVRARACRQRSQPLPSDIVVILSSGMDFFNDLAGGPDANLPLLEFAWRNPDLHDQVIERRASRGQGPSWASLVFDEGMDPAEARHVANGFATESEDSDA